MFTQLHEGGKGGGQRIVQIIPLSETHLQGGWCHHAQPLHHSIEKGWDHRQMLIDP